MQSLTQERARTADLSKRLGDALTIVAALTEILSGEDIYVNLNLLPENLQHIVKDFFTNQKERENLLAE